MLPDRESLTVEFKSDHPPLPDREMVQTAVCLANADGGTIYVGVEDDGRMTGLQPQHHDVAGLTALISNRTVPPLSVRARLEAAGERRYLAVEIPRSDRPVATTDGTLLWRRMKADGKSECAAFYPHEWARRASDLGQLDYSALPMSGVGPEDLDPLERVRLRQAIERYGGDRALLGLSDEELDGRWGWCGARAPARSCPSPGCSCWGALMSYAGTSRLTRWLSRSCKAPRCWSTSSCATRSSRRSSGC